MARVPAGSHSYLGAWKTQREAAEAYDRAVIYYRGPGAPRNFPGKRLVPSSVRALQDEARARAKQLTSSSFRGVVQAGPSWIAQVKVRGRHIGLGHWPTEIAAAKAYDRAVAFYRLDTRTLNFPDRPLAPLAAAELRLTARLIRKAERATSRYRGVFLAARDTARPWLAQLTVHGRPTMSLGTWETERDAARAYDRAGRHFRLPKTALNFPTENLSSAAPSALVSEARRQGKRARSSRYIGVSWMSNLKQWRGQIQHHSRNIHIGLFSDERRAAQAYDAKAIALRGSWAKINFHPDTGQVVTGHRLGDLPVPERTRRRRGLGQPHRAALE
jgi:hypothetical protein